jgi:hypothetical protein
LSGDRPPKRIKSYISKDFRGFDIIAKAPRAVKSRGRESNPKEMQGMTNSILPNDNNNDRIDRLETLMERLINVNLSNQEQIGFLAATLCDTRQSIGGMGDRMAHLETGQAETHRKIDIILQHITGMGQP